MTEKPEPPSSRYVRNDNPMAVLFVAIAAVCVLSLCGLGLWSYGHEAGIHDVTAQMFPVPCKE